MPILPDEFGDLEPFADWSLESEAERYAKRLSSTLDELQAFYDAAFPRLEDALLLTGECLVPGRGVATTSRARQRGGQPGHAHRAGSVTGPRR